MSFNILVGSKYMVSLESFFDILFPKHNFYLCAVVFKILKKKKPNKPGWIDMIKWKNNSIVNILIIWGEMRVTYFRQKQIMSLLKYKSQINLLPVLQRWWLMDRIWKFNNLDMKTYWIREIGVRKSFVKEVK